MTLPFLLSLSVQQKLGCRFKSMQMNANRQAFSPLCNVFCTEQSVSISGLSVCSGEKVCDFWIAFNSRSHSNMCNFEITETCQFLCNLFLNYSKT